MRPPGRAQRASSVLPTPNATPPISRPAPKREAGVTLLLAHRPDVVDAGAGHDETDLRVAHAERAEARDLSRQLVAERFGADDRVDLFDACDGLRGQSLRGALREKRSRKPSRLSASISSPAAARCPPKRARARRTREAPPEGQSRGRFGPSPCPAPQRRGRSGSLAAGGARPYAKRRCPPRLDASPHPTTTIAAAGPHSASSSARTGGWLRQAPPARSRAGRVGPVELDWRSPRPGAHRRSGGARRQHRHGRGDRQR